MARDRQRAKQRRAKRQPGQGQRSTRDVERELGLGGDETVDSPLGEGTAAPDPLDHASAEVDQARIAELGPAGDDDPDEAPGAVRAGDAVGRGRDAAPDADDFELADDEDDEYRAPDEAEADALVPVRERDPAARSRGRLITFLGHCVDELRRVQWPDRRHVGQATAVVLGFVVLAGGYLGLLDALWRPLVEAIL